MKVNIQKVVSIAGIFGIIIISICSLTTALAYTGTAGESYSILNHYISELGQVGVSRYAQVFNTGLILSGICFSIFMFCLGLYYKSILGYIAGSVGAFASIAMSFVGIFPMNHLATHVMVANIFFYSGLLAILLFTILIFTDKKNILSKWLSIPGFIALGSFVYFVFEILNGPKKLNVLSTTDIVRPQIWINSIAEWSILITMLIWILCISIYLLFENNKSTINK